MKFLENQQYIVNDDGEISLALEAYRQYELSEGYQILYASDWKTDGDITRKTTEQRINELKNSSN
ncbi:hypothetical protein P9305_04145 [Lysinibacillus capsici]|uniref:hypothetical protein n=1 Tax=Lysinibacillus capsici TaxID=2115968 RepID=UPI002E2111BE|nr:hypothetical protein [Lysinibacillus capsici]